MADNIVPCDRCGAMYDYTQNTKVDMDSDKHFYHPNEYWVRYEHWDLCPKCRIEFQRFMNAYRLERDAG